MNDNLVTDNLGDIRLYNGDCMDWMQTVPDNYYELAIVDPPYGVGMTWTKDKDSKFYKHRSSYRNNTCPNEEYFNNLFRISKGIIIFGANYYTNYLPPRNSWIIWDKEIDYNKHKHSECELAWTNFNVPSRIARFAWNGFVTCEKRYGNHPHEKPVKLYEWLLTNYAKKGDKIFDSHFGSLSIGIACHNLGFKLDACELDSEYYQASLERLKNHQRQLKLF